jgi:hypothetical protein
MWTPEVVTIAHVDRMCRKLYKSLGKYVVISIDNNHNCTPAQYNAEQTVVNEEMKGDHDWRKMSKQWEKNNIQPVSETNI